MADKTEATAGKSATILRSHRGRILGGLLVFGLLGTGIYWMHAQEQPPVSMNKFTLARIRYGTGFMRGWFRGRRRGGDMAPWSHDYPRSEQNFMKILSEVTRIDANPEGHIVSFEDEEVFKFPIAYLCEVGYLDLSEQEMHNMSEYLLRGGFLIVDDFRGERDFDNFKQQLRMIFPDRILEELPRSHPIFNCFYDISNVFPPQPPIYRRMGRWGGGIADPQYFGMSDDKGRLMMVVDYNQDISDYWEWSDDPFWPIEDKTGAYKYGVNYVMYALTH